MLFSDIVQNNAFHVYVGKKVRDPYCGYKKNEKKLFSFRISLIFLEGKRHLILYSFF